MSFQDNYNSQMQQQAYDGCRYVFKTEAIEDRAATIAAGHLVYRNRDICDVFKVGGNGDKVAWIIEELPPEKMQRIASAYAAWKKGEEAPLSGTDLRLWPLVTPAEIENLKHVNVRSVEDLANLPDNLMPNVGMGGRALRDKARAWLTSATDNGKLAQQISALIIKVEALTEQNAEKDKALAELHERVSEVQPRRGRPPRQEEAAA